MSSNKPYFSIIIPTYNRPGQLQECLQAISCLDYPRDCHEVIVVDDGGKTSLESVISRFYEEFNFTLITQENGGPAAARNAGATKAKGEFLAFTDDDCKPDPGWLEILSMRFTSTPDVAIGGRTLNSLTDNLYSTAAHMLIEYLYEYFNRDHEKAQFFASNNLALPAEKFHQLGGFNTAFPLAAGEDREFCDHWLHRGNPLAYVPEAIVYHTHSLTFRSFWRMQFNYGRGALYFHHVRTQRNQKSIRVEPLKFYLDLMRYPLSKPSDHPAPILAALLAVSQVANAAGFFLEHVRRITFR